MNGLMSMMIPMEMELETMDAEENKRITLMMVEEWNLGPEVPSEKPDANSPYWTKMAEVWQTEEATARRRMCANCEYFDNTPERLEVAESVPFNEFDEGAGGRGYCHKFEFICHNLRTCQAWDRKDYEEEED